MCYFVFMKRIFIIFLLFIGGCGGMTSNQNSMKLTSTAFEHEGMIPAKYTCANGEMSPPLSISDVPEGTKSMVLIMDDPDAPMETWVHWIVGGIDPSVKEIEEGTIPGTWEGKNSWGKNEYGGPCPPSGTHRYFFKLYALDIELGPLEDKAAVESAMLDHVIEKVELIALYIKRG